MMMVLLLLLLLLVMIKMRLTPMNLWAVSLCLSLNHTRLHTLTVNQSIKLFVQTAATSPFNPFTLTLSLTLTLTVSLCVSGALLHIVHPAWMALIERSTMTSNTSVLLYLTLSCPTVI